MEIKGKKKNQSSVPLFLPLVRLAIKSTIVKHEVTPHKRGAPYGWRKDGRSVGRAGELDQRRGASLSP